MSNVYILSDTGHDLSDAKKFGEIIIVSEEKYPIFNPSEVIQTIRRGLLDFNEHDYLIVSGASLVLGLALSHLFLSGAEKINVLIFDAKRREYVPRTLTSNQLN